MTEIHNKLLLAFAIFAFMGDYAVSQEYLAGVHAECWEPGYYKERKDVPGNIYCKLGIFKDTEIIRFVPKSNYPQEKQIEFGQVVNNSDRGFTCDGPTVRDCHYILTQSEKETLWAFRYWSALRSANYECENDLFREKTPTYVTCYFGKIRVFFDSRKITKKSIRAFSFRDSYEMLDGRRFGCSSADLLSCSVR